jgi:hypothetical protein
MVESRDELIMEIMKETGLDHVGEDAKDEEADEDADDRGDVTAPPVHVPQLLHLRRSSWRKALWRWFLNKKLMWRMKSSWQMVSLRCRSPVSTTCS